MSSNPTETEGSGFTPEDKRKVAVGVAFSVIGGICFAGFKGFSFVARYIFGGQAFGLYMVAYALLELCTHFILGGFSDALVYHASKHLHGSGDDREDRLYRSIATALRCALLLALLLAVVIRLGVEALYTQVWSRHDPLIVDMVGVLVWGLPLLVLMHLPAEAVKARLNMRWLVSVTQIGFPVFSIATTLILHYGFGMSIMAMVYGLLTGMALCIPLSWYGYSRHFSLAQTARALFSNRWDWSVPGFALPQSVNMLCNLGLVRLDTLMLSLWVNANAVGVYGLVSEATQLVRLAKVSFSGMFNPLVSKYRSMGERRGLTESLHGLVRVTSLLSLLPVIPVLVFYPDVIVKDASWEFSLWFPWLLLAGPLMSCFFGLAGNLLLMTGHARLLLFNSIAMGFLNLILNWIFIPKWGLTGAALATAISNVSISLLQIYEMGRLEGIRYRAHLYMKPVAVYALAVPLLCLINLSPVRAWIFSGGFSQGILLKAVFTALLLGLAAVIVLRWPGPNPELSLLRKAWDKLRGRRPEAMGGS